jgi:hypothetical protein
LPFLFLSGSYESAPFGYYPRSWPALSLPYIYLKACQLSSRKMKHPWHAGALSSFLVSCEPAPQEKSRIVTITILVTQSLSKESPVKGSYSYHKHIMHYENTTVNQLPYEVFCLLLGLSHGFAPQSSQPTHRNRLLQPVGFSSGIIEPWTGHRQNGVVPLILDRFFKEKWKKR